MTHKLKESDLFQPLQIYLTGQGYSVHSEVKNCDLVAVKEDEMIIVELKVRMSLQLLMQAVRRKELTESVYVAVALPEGRDHLTNLKGLKKLLRRLEVGFILVDFKKTLTRINILLHPMPFKERRLHKRRAAIIREIDGRYHEFNKAGEPVTTERITAYKQQAIRIAWYLARCEHATPAELMKMGTEDKTGVILSANVYGWFDRIKRGHYSLNESGRLALEGYQEYFEKLGLK